MVLIVEDNVDACRMLTRYFRSEGLTADCAFSGEEAIAKIRTGEAKVLVLDQMMPGMSGIDVLRHVRSDPKTAAMPAVFYSASSHPADRDEAARLGAKWFTKGAALRELVAAVRQLCAAA